MGSFQWFIITLIVIAGLAYWNYQRIDGQRKELLGAGFQVTDDLKGNPGLLVSTSQRQVAVLIPSGYIRFSFDQLQGAEVRSDTTAEANIRYRIAMMLDGAPVPEVEVGFADEHRADIALKKLRQLTGH